MTPSVDQLIEQAQLAQNHGELERAEALFSRVRGQVIEAGDKRAAALTARRLGVISLLRGDHDQTLRHYRTSLNEFRALGAPKDVLAALSDTGMLCTDLERWDDAACAFDEAVEIADALGDIPARVLLEVNRAELEIARRDFVTARAVCLSAVQLSAQTPDACALGEIERQQGAIARELGELPAADGHFERAQEIAASRGDLLLSAETAREHADLCSRQGRYRDALLHLNRGHQIFSELVLARDIPDIERRYARLERHFIDAVRHWSGSIESKDRYTQGHCERVADLACALALRAGIATRELFWIRVGALVHDVGKLIISPELLNKPGRLAPDEWDLVKRHPAAGVEMLADMNFAGDVIPMVRSHHERWDGRGYPDQLVADAIPRAARMLCIADIYDALTSKRSYKGALSHEAAMAIMRSDVGKQFDPKIFADFEDVMRTRAPSLRHRAAVEYKAGPQPGARALRVSGPSDDLTGLLMRGPFIEMANTILGERGPFATVSLIVIDVDEFKKVNDAHGHLQGDAVLRVVTGTLRELAASTGIIGRYAGDEFVILLPHAPAEEAAELAERIRLTVRQASVPLREHSGSSSVTLSLGVAAARPEHRDFDSLFAAADRALYEAKRRGRDTVVTATEAEEGEHAPTIDLKQFVGRDAEIRRLIRLLDESVNGAPLLVSVVGEAGVGKSTVARRLTTEAAIRGGSLVAGRCSEADAKAPYAPWAEAISALQRTGVVARKEWPELSRLVPALAACTVEGSANKYALFGEIVAFLRLAAAAAPLVVLIDDMQWADAGTWDVLEHVMTQAEHERILICVTMRTEDTRGIAVERRHRLVRDERFHEIQLRRLSDAELGQWLCGVLGGETSSGLLAYLRRGSEGNPLLATQIVRMLLDENAVRYEHGHWGLRADVDARLPSALSGLIDRRLERLSQETRRILNTAAVIGRDFDMDLAIAAGAGTEDEMLDAIDEAIAHAVIEPVADASPGHFAFTHGLLVDAVRRSINPRRLARIHERIGQAIEQRTPQSAAEIASHYDQAGIPEKTYRHAMAAGDSSLATYAHGEARTFFEVAERVATDPVDRAWALHRLAEVAETEGRHALGEELCDRALAGLDGRPDDHVALGLRRMRHRTRALQGQPAQATIAACRELLMTARALGDHAEESQLLNMISQYEVRLGEWREAEDAACEAVAAAEKTNDARLLAESLTRLGTSVIDRRSPDAADFHSRALSLFRSVGDRGGEARCHINIGLLHRRSGQSKAAESAFDQALEAATVARAVDLAGLASLNLGISYLRSGRLELASERYHEALGRFTESANESHRLSTLYNMAHLARESEDWATASALYDQVVAVAARIGQPDVELGARAGHALASLAVGARSVADDAMRWIRANVETRPDWWFQGRDLVDVLRIRMAAERGDDAHALRLLHDAIAIARRHDPYAAAYLVSACAPSFRRSQDALLASIDEMMPEAVALGFVAIAERLSALRAVLASSSRAA
jgi:diguanylate cyclase (GGDEF)-like protein/putative nucleotidyltransferase with HDIG domain